MFYLMGQARDREGSVTLDTPELCSLEELLRVVTFQHNTRTVTVVSLWFRTSSISALMIPAAQAHCFTDMGREAEGCPTTNRCS